jgi:ubiquinone biosynthesis protein UbiJ
MHQAQLVTSAVEFAINKALSFDEESHLLLQPLVGKQFEIKLHELTFPLVFSFHPSGVVVNSVEASNGSLYSHTSPVNTDSTANSNTAKSDIAQKSQDYCSISLSVFIISELRDTSNITRLIREEKLDFDGNLQIAQSMSALFDGLQIDIEEVLSQYIGDIAAHHTMQTAASFGQFIKRNHSLAMQALSDAILDEKPIGVRPIMLENYIQEVSELRNATARLDARLAILETNAENETQT